ncbi:hypothetical protein JWG39_11410 [Desulforhopalus vacuolatus]|uniref:hypothetical protein n=1 Tax=Desulforhopalus vacuolatus TaxID=40414 RepID=UPI001964D56F|nr:hypothetical protein [Desulforhopalus vacuolatus]MBM9520420.1 hypothetical protein [Desulforhopalus vacuolatus]
MQTESAKNGNKLKIWKTWKNFLFEKSCWLVLGLSALFAPMASDSTRALIECWILSTPLSSHISHNAVILYCVYIGIFFITFGYLYWMRRYIFYPQTKFLFTEKNPEKRKNLILFLSNIYMSPENEKKESFIPAGLSLSGDMLTEDLKRIEKHKQQTKPWSWQMPLIGLKHHLPGLKSVTIVCSHESLKQMSAFVKILKLYKELENVEIYILGTKEGIVCRDKYSVDNHLGGFNFEGFDELSAGMRACIDLMKKDNVKEKDMMIDFTGGNKVTSVVAATITFNRPIKAQYVSTTNMNVVGYDVDYGTVSIQGVTG